MQKKYKMVDIAASAAPTVTIYLNGNSNFYGKKFVVNRRRVRTFDAFLDNVTVDIKSSKAIRRLCTPLGTHEVNSLETLEHGGKYVAVTNIGRSGFKKLNYGELGVLKTSPRARKPRGLQFRNKLIVSGRARQEYEWEKLALKIIKVYRNGDEFQPSTRVLLRRKVLQNMELVLITCQEHMVLNSAIAALYTTDGKIVGDTALLENGGMYVAVERRRPFFQHVNYGERGHVPLRRSGPVKLPPIGNGQMTGAKTKLPPGKAKSVSPSKAKDTLSTSRAQEAILSRDLTPDHQQSNKLLYELESEADFNPSVSPPLRLDETPFSDIPKRTQAKVSEVQAEGPSVFEASGLQSEKAKSVRDTRDTVEEKPVDLLPAEEVVEDLEEAENEDDHKNSEQNESRSGSPANEVESDSDVESIPNVTENNHVTAEEPSHKAWGDKEESAGAMGKENEKKGNDSRGSSSHSRRASNASEEKSTAQRADSIASPPPERTASSKEEEEEDKEEEEEDKDKDKKEEADPSSLGGSADVDAGTENEEDAENEDEIGKGDERRSGKRDEEGNEDANLKVEDTHKSSPEILEDDQSARAQDDESRSERSSAKETHDKK